jgi:Icc-related predicted phosphoesterase
MRLWLFSDLHMRDGSEPPPPIPDADVCVVAGDLIEGRPDDGVAWLDAHIAPAMPVVYVLGNHEFYNVDRTMDVNRALAQRAAARTQGRVHVLDDGGVDIGGMRFLGSTLWTDFDVHGEGDEIARAYAMNAAASSMMDYRFLAEGFEQWSPDLSRRQHLQSRRWLEQQLAIPTGPTVVVSHHAPHWNSIETQYEMDLISAAFVSDLSDIMRRFRPAHWLHGHTHHHFDYDVHGTRVTCNPKGIGRENRFFDPGMVITVRGTT